MTRRVGKEALYTRVVETKEVIPKEDIQEITYHQGRHLDVLPEDCSCPVEPHSCPYQCDVNDDYDYLCQCCEECEHECADGI